MDRLGFKFIVLSLDSRTHAYINEHMSTVPSFELKGRKTVHESASLFRTSQFNLIAERKVEGVLHALRLGFNVLFADTDIALLRDPFRHLLWNNVDYVHSINQVCNK